MRKARRTRGERPRPGASEKPRLTLSACCTGRAVFTMKPFCLPEIQVYLGALHFQVLHLVTWPEDQGGGGGGSGAHWFPGHPGRPGSPSGMRAGLPPQPELLSPRLQPLAQTYLLGLMANRLCLSREGQLERENLEVREVMTRGVKLKCIKPS